MTREELIERTMCFAVRVLTLVEALPRAIAGRTIANQLARSGTSVAANYRAAIRGKSRADFANKINICLEEADECACWIELAKRKGLLTPRRLQPLLDEAIELTRIFNATLSSTRDKS